MSREKDKVIDVHRVDRILLLQEDPDLYLANKRRINFGFVTSEAKLKNRTNRK
ncbi:MAG TPA: hypothetical protein K8W18_11885 [Corynebacterium glutamicum]|nr:hypothetical protein [Corynebacterium glutamicum]